MGSLTSNDGTINGVDTGNAIGAKAVFAATVDNPNTTFKDWISGETIDISAVTGISVVNDGTHGYVMDINAADTPSLQFVPANLGPGETGITFSGVAQYMALAISDIADVGGTQQLWQSSGAGTDALQSFYRAANENWSISIGTASGNDTTQAGNPGYTSWCVLGGSRNNPDGQRTIVNGTEGTRDTTYTDNPNAPPSGHTFYVGTNSSNQAWDGAIGMLVIFDEELSTAENTSFATNPWQIFSAGASGSTTHQNLPLLGVG